MPSSFLRKYRLDPCRNIAASEKGLCNRKAGGALACCTDGCCSPACTFTGTSRSYLGLLWRLLLTELGDHGRSSCTLCTPPAPLFRGLRPPPLAEDSALASRSLSALKNDSNGPGFLNIAPQRFEVKSSTTTDNFWKNPFYF